VRGIVVLALASVALTACAAGSAGTSATTSLTVTFWSNGANTTDREQWTLRCDPPGGTLPRPRIACRRLAEGGPKLLAPLGPNTMCTQIYGGPQTARVVGRVASARVSAGFSRKDGCQIARWNRLSPWLLPAGTATR
jgi:hypothetical protein